MIFCYKRDDAKASVRARHELFHAFQFNSLALQADYKYVNSIDPKTALPSERAAFEDYKWITESTAAAAEELGATMSRSSIMPRDLHPINVALSACDYFIGQPKGIQYQAQDFWVYFGLKRNLGLAYLQPLFEGGARAAAVDKFFIERHNTALGVEYWEWVKNQAIEKTINFNGALQNPGQIEASWIGKSTQYPLDFPSHDQLPSVEGTLPRLTSEVVAISFEASEVGGTYKVTVGASAGGGAVDGFRYKIYKQGDTNFEILEDSSRTFDHEPTPFLVYVVLSNINYQFENSLKYQVTILES